MKIESISALLISSAVLAWSGAPARASRIPTSPGMIDTDVQRE